MVKETETEKEQQKRWGGGWGGGVENARERVRESVRERMGTGCRQSVKLSSWHLGSGGGGDRRGLDVCDLCRVCCSVLHGVAG